MGVGSPGLDLLASAALAPEKREGNGSLLKPGPFNPAASLAKKVTKRILDLEYVEMAEVTADTLPESVSGRPHPPVELSKFRKAFNFNKCSCSTLSH